MGAGGSFEYVAKFVEGDPDLAEDEQKTLAAYVREHKITGKRAKRRFGNDKAALDAIAGPKAGAVCRARPRQKKVKVGKKAEEFFENVKDFISAKHEIDSTAEQVLPRSYMDSYKSFKPAVLRHGEGMSIDDVYQSAECTRSAFERAARSVVEAAGLDPDAVVQHEGEELMLTDELPFTRLCVAPPKGHARAAEKIRDDYDGDASRLVDVNRCSIVVDEEQQLVAVASKLMEGSLCEVVRLKNRFAEPLFNGYRDALYSVRVSSGDTSHVCELQLHLAAVIAHKEKTHHYYEWRRRAETKPSLRWRAGGVYTASTPSTRRLAPRSTPREPLWLFDVVTIALHAIDATARLTGRSSHAGTSAAILRVRWPRSIRA